MDNISENLSKIYLDEGDILEFGEYYLDEVIKKKLESASIDITNSTHDMKFIIKELMEEKI